jgi:hypothetical protein
MPGQAEYSSLPSLEVSPVIATPKTETFSDTLMKKILQSHPDINPELTQEIQNPLRFASISSFIF